MCLYILNVYILLYVSTISRMLQSVYAWNKYMFTFMHPVRFICALEFFCSHSNLTSHVHNCNRKFVSNTG